jgi:hypothetical protein
MDGEVRVYVLRFRQQQLQLLLKFNVFASRHEPHGKYYQGWFQFPAEFTIRTIVLEGAQTY